MPAISAGTTLLSTLRGLDQLNAVSHHLRLGLFRLDAGNAYVDIENVGARLNLGQGILDHAVEVAGLHFCGETLASGRVDALADDHKRLVRANGDGAGCGFDDGVHGETCRAASGLDM